MGIYGALTTAVTGLRAQSTALANISGNIANSQTTGYKRMETSFIDLVPDAAVGRQIPGAVLAQSRSTNDVRGDIVTSATGTHIALNGTGFFVVAEKTGTSDGVSVFSDSNYYTRRGDFELDREGYLVNGAGYYLRGVPVDSKTGNVAGSMPGMIQISNGLLPAQRTERINYQLNLPEEPAVGLLTVPPTDPDFLEQTLDGGGTTIYGPNGAARNVQLRWGKTGDTPDTWQLYYQDQVAGGDWAAAPGGGVAFDVSGSLTPPGAFKINIPAANLVDPTLSGPEAYDVEINFGARGLTQQANATGRAQVSMLDQNGYPAGSFTSVAINDSGRVVASYSNGEQIELFQVVTANFNAENMLKRMDGGVYTATAQSGEAVISLDGSITGGALETSNTDISEEFTKLITTQQAYAAGTRIVSTSDEMLQEALNMVR